MSVGDKILKLSQLMRRPSFAHAVVRHRVAATIEHLDAIKFCSPATVIDVGANKGQFSTAVRGLCPRALIHAFEPLPAAADRFHAVFRHDPLVHLHRVAIGAETSTSTFYVADREDSSSLLEPGSGQQQAYGVRTEKQINVEVKLLEDVIDPVALPRPVLLKIDVQGAELEVLRGIENLEPFDFIYVELSFVELYVGQSVFNEVYAHLSGRGFSLRGVYNQSVTRAFGPTQADCLFLRSRKGYSEVASNS